MSVESRPVRPEPLFAPIVAQPAASAAALSAGIATLERCECLVQVRLQQRFQEEPPCPRHM